MSSTISVSVLLVICLQRSAIADDSPPLAIAPFSAKQAQGFQQQWANHIGKEQVHTNSIGMKLKLIPPGEYTMGRTEEQFDKIVDLFKKNGRKPSRLATWEMLMMPAHQVRITKPFYMGSTEVTVGQFRQFCESSGYKTEAERGLDKGVPYKRRRPICTWRKPMVWIKLKQKDDEPVLHLCWNDCVAFCKWLSKKEGVEYCLPTEAEWEYACRAGTTTAWSFGNFEDFDRLGHQYMFVSELPQGKHDRPSRVGLKKPNAFGLYDMHGNVWEYVADWWHRFTYKNSPINDPIGPPEQSEKGDMRRVIRTGSFDWGRWGAQSVYRMRIGQQSTQHPHQGFRVAMRLKGIKGAAPAVEPYDQRRKNKIDPGPQKVDTSVADKHPKELTIDLPGGVTMDFVLIRPGSFLMGSSKGFGDETPVHRVVISKPFYMAKYETTTAQWAAVMGKDDRFKFWETMKGPHDDAIGPRKAMRDVSWDECQALIAALQKKVADSLPKPTGYKFALPAEAQWEYACRGGSTTEFHFGDDAAKLGEYAWFAGNMRWPGGGRTLPDGTPVKGVHYHTVGQKQPNAFGLYDMHGGIWEWCADYYDKDYYLNSPLKDPTGPKSGKFRALRGGSWFRYAKYCRSAYRRFFYPASNGDGVTAYISDFGCRVVINLDDVKQAGKSAQQTRTLRLAENLVKHQANPVLDIGKKGDWDESNCGCFSVAQVNGRLYLYYMGSGSNHPWRIGLATSGNGTNWQRHESNPVLPPGDVGSWDHRAVSMPSVLNNDGQLLMWYSGSGKGGGFGLATSDNGVNWERHGNGPVMRGIGGSMDPCVRKFDDQFVMWYCGKSGGSYRIMQATSPDGIRWTKNPQPVLPLGDQGDFDETSHAGPVVLKNDAIYYLFHLGGSSQGWKMGLATSSDGVHWTKSAANPILDAGGENAWDSGSILSLDVLWMNGRFHVWYAAASKQDAAKKESEQAIRIGYATSSDQPVNERK